MDQPDLLNKKLKIPYTHPKVKISKKFLYFYHEIETSKTFHFFVKPKFWPTLRKNFNFL